MRIRPHIFAGLFLVLLALTPATGAAQQQTAPTEATIQPPLPVLHVHANLIQIPVLVLYPTHDKVVTSIAPDRFSLSFDSGPFVKATNARIEGDDPIDLAIVVDARGAQNYFLPKLDETIANLAPAQLQPQDHVSLFVMTCGSIRSVQHVPATDSARLKTAVDTALTDWTTRRVNKDKSPCSSSAPVMDLLAYAASGLAKAPGRRVILAFTNGDDKTSAHTWDFVSTLAQDLGVTIFALNADSGTTHFSDVGDPTADHGRGSLGTGSNPLLPSATYDPHDMVLSALAASIRAEPVFRLTDLCELTGGVELRIDRNDPVPTLKRAVEMIRNRYVLDFPLLTPGHHDLRVSIERENFFIRPAGNGFVVANSSQPPSPNTSQPGSAPATQLASAPVTQTSEPTPAPISNPTPPADPNTSQSGAAPTTPTAQVASASVTQPSVPTPVLTSKPMPQQTALPTLKATVRLVYVDVVIHDKSGKPIHDLKPEDFALLENGQAQTFKGFEEHASPTAEQMARMPVPAQPKLAEGTFSNVGAATTPQANGPLNILLLDRLNTSVGDQKEMKEQINEYLLHAPAGQRMAIFGLADRLMLLQGFTTDAGAVHTAANDAHGLSGTSLLSPPVELLFLHRGNTQGSPDDDSDSSRGPTAEMTAGPGAPPETAHNRELLAANQVELRVLTTLHAMDELARYLATLPGRKNLIWFSGSFPVDVMPTMDVQTRPVNAPSVVADDPFTTVKSAQRGFEQTSALLSRAQVAVYPIDVKGLKVASVFSANEAPPEIPGQLIQDFNEHNYGEHTTMNELAEGTGGKAFLNTNDFVTAMGKALDDGGNYYTIAYAPSDPRWDGRFRNITVKLRAKGYSLSYRKGYFAQDVKEPLGSKPMQIALLHGGPEPAQIVFSTRVRPVGIAPEEKATTDNKLGATAKAPFRRYRVEFALPADQVQLTETPDGNRHVTVEFAVAVYDRDGTLMNSISRGVQAKITPAAYAQFQQKGVPFTEEVSVPAKGEYFLRIAVHQVETDHVGAVEIPVASVSKLQPLEVSAAGPTPGSSPK